MPKIQFQRIEILTGSILLANFLTLIYSVWLQDMKHYVFYALILTLMLLSFLFAFIIARSRQRTGDKLEKARNENKHLQDYISASWSSNQKIIQEEKILAVRFMMMGVSHEIGTPLGNALTSVSVMESLLKKHSIDDKDLIYAKDLCRNSIERTIELVSRFKDVANVSLKEDQQKFRLRDVIKNVSTVKGHEWKGKNVPINIKCNRDISINSYPYSLSIVLGVLLDNACESYGEANGEIKVNCSRVQNDLEIRIIDKGSGILPENRKQIFDPFFTTLRSEKHIGLGLPIAHNLVSNLFKGELKIDSQWQEGTTVYLQLPEVFSPLKVSI